MSKPSAVPELQVVLTRTYDRKPLAVVRNLPGLDAEMTPSQMRALAAALLEAADDCESCDTEEKNFRDTDKSYALCAPAQEPATPQPTPATAQYLDSRTFDPSEIVPPLRLPAQDLVPVAAGSISESELSSVRNVLQECHRIEPSGSEPGPSHDEDPTP